MENKPKEKEKRDAVNMSSDIIAEIEKGRKVGYSDSLIKKSLEVEGYSSGSIKQAFRELENRKKSNGNGFVVKTKSIKKEAIKAPAELPDIARPVIPEKKQEEEMPKPIALLKKEKPKKHWLIIIAEIMVGIILFAFIGVLIYLYLLPAVTAPIT